MAQTKLCSDIEIPKEVYNKWKDFIKLVGNIILSIKQIPELEGKFKELLKKGRYNFKSDDFGGQLPEPFTRQKVIEPILEFLGYEFTSEISKKSPLGDRKIPDYRVSVFNKEILIEAEPLGSDLNKKDSGIHQVKEWLIIKSYGVDTGIATNGLEWVLLHYDDTIKEIRTLKELNLKSIFEYVLENKKDKDLENELKQVFSEFYYCFSKEYIEEYIEVATKNIKHKKEEITNEFYKEFVKLVFGFEDVKDVKKKDKSSSEKDKGTKKCLYNCIEAPPNTSELDKKKFAVLLMNRLIFIKFLEDKGIVPRDLLRRTYEDYKKSNVLINYYDAYLKPLFYEVLNTPEDERKENIRTNPYYKDIPYLNGGLFRSNNVPNELSFTIKDNEIIGEVINFLERYKFTLSTSEGSEEVELNPDILGYVYEKLINILAEKGQKGLGAYYTPDEITSYIAKNTIEPIVVERFKEIIKNWKINDINFSTLDEILNEDSKIAENKHILRAFLDELDKIRILDPAVGSGHFLISALKELLQIKKRIYYLLREEMDIYKEKLGIILNNLYGVDIDDIAVEIAKLRLWLALIENLDVEALKRGEVLLPNIEYNVRCGNSLVGWIDENLKQLSISYLCDNVRIMCVLEGLIINAHNSEERKKLKKAKELLEKRDGYVLDNYVEAYHLLYEVYRTSHGLKANLLKELLDEIRDSIYESVTPAYFAEIYQNGNNKKNNGKKSKKNRPRVEEFEKLKPFHWKIDFGWIIKEEGFDVIIGNPPYGNLLSPTEKEIMKRRDTPEFDIFVTFIVHSSKLLKNEGYLGFIIPSSFGTGVRYSNLRKELFTKMCLKKLIYLPFDVFSGAYVDNCIIILHKKPPKSEDLVLIYAFPKKTKKISFEFKNDLFIEYSKILNDPKCRIFPKSPEIYIILDKIKQNCRESLTYLEDLTESTIGILASKYKFSDKKENEYYLPYLEGNVYRYETKLKLKNYVDFSKHKNNEKLINLFMSPEKIFIRRIVNRQDRIMASYGNIEGVVKKDLYVFVLKPDTPINYFYLLGILNSELISYIYIGKSAIALKDDFRQTTLEELRELPIVIPKNKNIINALTQLSKLRFELNDKLNENDRIFLENIIDSLVYGIYFQDLIPKEELNEICNEINGIIKKYDEKSIDCLKYCQNIIKLLNTINTNELVRKIRNKN